MATKWFYAAASGPLDIEPGSEADALVARIFERLKATRGIDGHSSSGGTYEKLPVKAIMVYWVADRLSTKFSLVNWEGYIYAFVSGESEHIEQDVQPWLEALEYSLSKVELHPSHAWQALIGMWGDFYGATSGTRMAGFTVGGMSAVLAGFEFEEQIPMAASLHSHQIAHWQPLVVTGSTVGHSWQAADPAARESLHLLCALLSIQTKRLWKLRHHPHPLELGTLSIPESSATLKRVACLDAKFSTEPSSSVELQLQHCWQACMEDPQSAEIVRTYYEAIQMSEHPSFALIGFVSVIEAVGAKLFPSVPSESCVSCGKPRTNSAAKQFRDALSLVLPPDRVKDVSQRLYKWRSGTAHAGRLHAAETLFGMPKMPESVMKENPSLLFLLRGPHHAQEISRDLLVHLLEKRPTNPSV